MYHILTAFEAIEGLAYVVQYKTVVVLWCESILVAEGPSHPCKAVSLC
jgi:hypothetical protein